MTVTWRRRLAMWRDDLAWRRDERRRYDVADQLGEPESWIPPPPEPAPACRNAVLPACVKCGVILVVTYVVGPAEDEFVAQVSARAVAHHKEKCHA